MKELEIEIINELITFYTNYITKGINNKLKEEAREIESRYLNTSSLVSNIVTQAIGRLVDFYAPTGIKIPTKDEAKGIIEDLKKRKEELENE